MYEKIKYIVPIKFRRFISKQHRKYVFNKAIKAYIKHFDEIHNYPKIVEKLVYGWGNQGWSAYFDYSNAIINYASKNRGVVLECGSGLSTILLGIIGDKKNFKTISLENSPEWGEKVKQKLKEFEIQSVSVQVNDLKDYGNFDWYSPDEKAFSHKYSLVICDGPPGKTRGGRIGLLPVMAKTFEKECIILFDDYLREEEKNVIKEWSENYSFKLNVPKKSEEYAVIHFNK